MSGDETFHRYRIVRRIARGGMAEVYLAMLRGPMGFEKPVALKKILPVYAGMEEFGVLFRDEARVTSLLEHSAIVQVYEFGSYEGEYFIAMEYVDGPDLEELLDRCRRRGILPPVEVVLHIGHELTRALEYAHGAINEHAQPLNLIHRDLSPPNILIGGQGEVKLTDFGVAKARSREAETRPGVLRGKYAYMSPEQVRQGPIDQRSDIFSVGIVIYEALTGVNPFEGSTDFQTMESVERAEVEAAGFLRPDTPPELDRILLACLEPDPDLRYQTASDLRRDLGQVVRSLRASEGGDLTVEFLRDVFPERAPDAEARQHADEGAPPWETLAHRIPAMLVPIPHPRRLRPANAARKLVMGDEGDAGADTANETPQLAPEGWEPPARRSEPGIELGSEPDDEWGDDDPDSIRTEAGVFTSAQVPQSIRNMVPGQPVASVGATAQLRPPDRPQARPRDELAAAFLGGSMEKTSDGVPVYNEWEADDQEDPDEWSMPSSQLATGRLPFVTDDPAPAHSLWTPALSAKVKPSRSLDEVGGVSETPLDLSVASNPKGWPGVEDASSELPGALDADEPEDTLEPEHPTDSLEPAEPEEPEAPGAEPEPESEVEPEPPADPPPPLPGSPVLRPRNRGLPPKVRTAASGDTQDRPRPTLLAPELPEPPLPEDGLVGDERWVPSTPSLTAVPAVPDGPEIPAPPELPELPDISELERPPRVKAAWIAIAALVPLLFLLSMDWLRDRQREAVLPDSSATIDAPAKKDRGPERAVEPLPPTRPRSSNGAPTRDRP